MAEELRAVDADHFWIGEVLVDLNQIAYEAHRVANRPDCDGSKSHSLGVALAIAMNWSERIAAGKVGPEHLPKIKRALLRLNQLGVPTGYVSKEGER